MTSRPWLPGEIDLLREMYPDTPSERIAQLMGRPVRSVYSKANALGLTKSANYYRTHQAGRVQSGDRGQQTRFNPGQEPWNKGRKGWQAGGRSVETQFKPGRPPHLHRNYVPIGTLRIDKNGRLERKVSDDQSIYPAKRWVPVARIVWEAAHGPIPPKHVVRFRDGMHTTLEHEITLDRLECVSQRENMRRNSYHTTHPELRQIVQLRGALTRKIRNREQSHADQDHR